MAETQQREQEDVLIKPPTGGLNVDDPTSEIADNESPDMSNFRFFKKRMRKRQGHAVKGQNLIDPIMLLDDLAKADGVRHSLALTTKKLFKFNTGADLWNEITRTVPAPFTGSDSDNFNGAVIQDKYAFSQGVDPIMITDGGTTYSVINAGTAPPAKYMVSFAGRLIIAHTVETGLDIPTMVRWPVRNNVLDWTGLGSGFQNINDTPDAVMGLSVIANSVCIIYKERNIFQMVETGQLGNPFAFNRHVIGTGPTIPESIVNVRGRDEDFFVGPDDVYLYSLNGLRGIGGNNKRSMLDSINQAALDKCFSAFIEDFGEIWLFVVTPDSQFPNLVWVYNFLMNTWYWFEFDFRKVAGADNFVRSMGYARRQGSTTYDQAVGTYDEQTVAYNSRQLGDNAPTNSLGTQGGQVFEFSESLKTDDGLPIKARWLSKGFDLGLPDFNKTLVRLKIGYVSASITSLLVDCSTDGGNTFEDEKSVGIVATPSGKETFSYYDTITTATRLHFRVRHVLSGSVDIVEMKPYFVIGGEEVPA